MQGYREADYPISQVLFQDNSPFYLHEKNAKSLKLPRGILAYNLDSGATILYKHDKTKIVLSHCKIWYDDIVKAFPDGKLFICRGDGQLLIYQFPLVKPTSDLDAAEEGRLKLI